MKAKYIFAILLILNVGVIITNWLAGNLIDNFQIFCGLFILISFLADIILEKIKEIKELTADTLEGVCTFYELMKKRKGDDNE